MDTLTVVSVVLVVFNFSSLFPKQAITLVQLS